MSDIERLRVVATVARTHSMHEAARSHGVAQSTVSRSVARIEELLGFPLFQRGTAGAQLAAGAGRALEVIERIVDGFDELRALGSARPAGMVLVRREEVPVPDHLDGTIARWNRAEAVPVEVVVDDDPLGAVREERAAFALVRLERGQTHDLEGRVVRLTRLDRVELINRPDAAVMARAFLRLVR